MILTLSYRMAGAVRKAPDVEADLRAIVEREPWAGVVIAKTYDYSANRRGLAWNRIGRGRLFLAGLDTDPLYAEIGEALRAAGVNDWQVELRTPKEPPASA